MNDSIMLVSLQQYNVNMVVQTTMKQIDEINDAIKDMRKSQLKKTYQSVAYNVYSANDYFDRQKHVDATSQEYKNFCDDCVILAVMGHALLNRPIHFVHPESYNNIVRNLDPRITGVELTKPDYVSDIPTVM